MSYNAALLKNIPIIVLSKQVCFLLFYLFCEAREVHSSEVKRVAQPAYKESIVVNGREHCPDPPFRIDTSIPMLLGVLVANRTQLNSIPTLPFPQNSHLAQGHAPSVGPSPYPRAGQCRRSAPLLQDRTTLMGHPSSRGPYGIG